MRDIDNKRAYERKFYLKNKEKILAKKKIYRKKNYEKNFIKNKERNMIYKINNKEKIIEYSRKYYQENKEKIRETQRLKHDPVKTKARFLARQAVKVGAITRNFNCEKCNKKCKTEMHHEDYSKPLEVTHICRSCHLELHAPRMRLK